MNQAEKRRHPRVPLRTSALLFDRRLSGEWEARRHALGRFKVVNVSMGGALIDGDLSLPVGTPVGLHLELPDTQVQMGSVVVRRDGSTQRRGLALCFEIIPARDEEAVRKAVESVLDSVRRRPSGVITPLAPIAGATFSRTNTDPEGTLSTPSGAAWYTLRELETVHAQHCQRCQLPFAARVSGMAESCRHGQDLRSLLRALTLVLADPNQYQHDLADCRTLTLRWLGRELESKTRDVLRMRLDQASALALSGGQ
jgi:PilZ domain-containing protein